VKLSRIAQFYWRILGFRLSKGRDVCAVQFPPPPLLRLDGTRPLPDLVKEVCLALHV
jgi:hypothetical protein